MAQLAQIRLILDVDLFTSEQINEYGRLTEKIASQLAKDIYRRKINIDVLLQDGSLIVKVTVIGSLLLAYHGVASYPDFKSGIVELCEDAELYSEKFVDKFLSQSGISEKHILKITKSTKTPGKIKTLTNKLEKLDGSTPVGKTEIKEELSKAKQVLATITRDMSDDEAANLKTLLEFKKLPPPSKWPSLPKKESSSGPAMKSFHRSEVPIGRSHKPRLRYHNVISVP